MLHRRQPYDQREKDNLWAYFYKPRTAHFHDWKLYWLLQQPPLPAQTVHPDSHAGSCQCHESGSLTGWLYKKFAVPLVKRRIKSYIIFIVYLTECTSNSVIYADWLLYYIVIANRRGIFPLGELSSAAFLVYVAAVLFYKPIFTQPLGFVLCAAGAVEKFATDRTVSVVYLRDSIGISKINAAFLTGQQIDRIHVQQLLFTMFVCKPHNTQRLLLYHEPSNSSIDPYAKK